jgi:hypothetical protein
MMNKYYALTDDSITFHISMGMFRIFSVVGLVILILMLPVLHPHYKTSYLVKAGWKREWIKTAEDLVQQDSGMAVIVQAKANGCNNSLDYCYNYSCYVHQCMNHIYILK